MNAALCSALTGVLPVIILTLVLESRAVSRRLRTAGRRSMFAYVPGTAAGVSMIALIISLIGVQTGGLGDLAASVEWLLVAVSLAALAVFVFVWFLTSDEEEHEKPPGFIDDSPHR